MGFLLIMAGIAGRHANTISYTTNGIFEEVESPSIRIYIDSLYDFKLHDY